MPTGWGLWLAPSGRRRLLVPTGRGRLWLVPTGRGLWLAPSRLLWALDGIRPTVLLRLPPAGAVGHVALPLRSQGPRSCYRCERRWLPTDHSVLGRFFGQPGPARCSRPGQQPASCVLTWVRPVGDHSSFPLVSPAIGRCTAITGIVSGRRGCPASGLEGRSHRSAPYAVVDDHDSAGWRQTQVDGTGIAYHRWFAGCRRRPQPVYPQGWKHAGPAGATG